ncbi:MAG: SH3 domain-containing protein [Desulfarculaceae bacterium]|nr:SH3 domain-containing protein [Desulfarculaceae bacterium]
MPYPRRLTAATLILALALGLGACCATAPGPGALISLPQDPAGYATALGATGCLVRPAWQKEQAAAYLREYFAVWERAAPKHDRAELLAMGHHLWEKPGVGANLRPLPVGYGQALLKAAHAQAYPSANWQGLTLERCDLRVLPTARPDFGPGAGGGYPFDRLQQTALPAGTPVRVWHQSPRGDWLVAETPLALGWLPARVVGRLSREQATVWQGGPFLAVTRDRAALRDGEGRFVMDGELGWLLPLRGESPKAWRVLIPRARPGGRADLAPAYLPKADGGPFPLPLTPARLAGLAAPLMGQPYAWGGLGGGRDCSSLLRDLLMPFGLWLPRNSSDQGKMGRVVRLEGLSGAAKIAAIRREGVPWLSILYLPGHVMLYLGSPGGQPRVLHDMWGLKTRGPSGEGRRVVGRVVITSLSPGAALPELARPEGLLLPRISALAVLAPPEARCP